MLKCHQKLAFHQMEIKFAASTTGAKSIRPQFAYFMINNKVWLSFHIFSVKQSCITKGDCHLNNHNFTNHISIYISHFCKNKKNAKPLDWEWNHLLSYSTHISQGRIKYLKDSWLNACHATCCDQYKATKDSISLEYSMHFYFSVFNISWENVNTTRIVLKYRTKTFISLFSQTPMLQILAQKVKRS